MKVLFLGCHCDDIELGAGGTIFYKKNMWDIYAHTFSKINPNNVDLSKIQTKALNYLGVKNISFGNLKTRTFMEQRQTLWKEIATIYKRYKPQLIFSNFPDEHVDHLVLYQELVRNNLNCSILLYSPKNNLNFNPNYFIKLNKKSFNKKNKCLNFYKIYKKKYYFQRNYILSQSNIYFGNTMSNFCEAFKIEKMYG